MGSQKEKRMKLQALIIAISALMLTGGCGKEKGEIDPDIPRTDEWIEDDVPGMEMQPEISENQQNNESANYGASRIPIHFAGRLADVFNDSNYRQYSHAERLGITPIRNIGDAYFTKRPLEKISTTDDYFVAPLTHSLPYLVPEASRLLTDIGKSFKDSLKSRGGSGYKIKVTSLLRTPSTVKRLRRVNRNATDSSTHQFATTFDISWSNFYCADSTRRINDGDLKNLLAEVLLDKRREGRCLVKFERKTCCFHITVVK